VTVRPSGTAVARAVSAVLASFEAYQLEFRDITLRAAWRQQERDWHGLQRDARDRLDLYDRVVRVAVTGLGEILGARLQDRALWRDLKAAYAESIAARVDGELGETFFNSVTRRVFGTVGVDAVLEFGAADADRRPRRSGAAPHAVHVVGADLASAVAAILASRRVANQPVAFDAARVACEIDTRWRAAAGGAPIEAVELLPPVFYRNKGAYLVGRVRGGARLLPLVVAMVPGSHGPAVDAVLMSEDEASIVFSFTRAYFLVDVGSLSETVEFLTSIMPAKRVAELYIALGFHKHGKAELYRDLVRHLARSSDRFEIAPGDRGMVMTVFTLPSYDVVFKVIRDRFAEPKSTTRRHVIDRYELVFKHDRAGRLVDAHEYEHLALPRDRISDSLLAELLASAASSVVLDGDRVVIRHAYLERRVRPLNLHLRQADPAAARAAVLDFGNAIKDLAATNIFPGDLLLKNFGVTRHGRVIFYDYDELGLLTDFSFRRMPPPSTVEEEMAGEPWFGVAPGDVFPEEFLCFIGLHGELRDLFVEAHGDLLTPEYWRDMQARLTAGEVVDIFPYRHGIASEVIDTTPARPEDPPHQAPSSIPGASARTPRRLAERERASRDCSG
jgi:isocitrate dehydrogenase kinase/phosphatase